MVFASNFCSYCGSATRRVDEMAVKEPIKIGEAAMVDTPSPDEQIEAGESKYTKAIVDRLSRQHVAPEAHLLFGLNYLMMTGIVPIFGIISIFVEPFLGLIVTIGYFLILGAVTHLMWNSYFFAVEELHFSKQYGIVHKQSVTIPYDQIQNVNISQTFIDQLLGLARVDIETAGNNKSQKTEVVGGSMSKAEGHLVGVTLDKAKEIREIILDNVAKRKS